MPCTKALPTGALSGGVGRINCRVQRYIAEEENPGSKNVLVDAGLNFVWANCYKVVRTPIRSA